jgi:hypothetical protein
MQANLDFHLTFKVELKHVAGLLAIAQDAKPVTKEEISVLTGIPTGRSSGKVVPHINYAEYMGLIEHPRADGRFILSRTELGSTVYREDPLLIEPLTHLMCHYWLCSGKGASLWYYLWREFVPTVGLVFEEKDFVQSACQRFKRKNVNMTPLKKCYTAEDSLGRLGMVQIRGATWTISPHKYNSQMRYLYTYTLLQEWETKCPDRPELTVPEITDILRWNNAYGWAYDDTLYTLTQLQALGMLNLNRQLEPITVIRNARSQDVLARLYSSLI